MSVVSSSSSEQQQQPQKRTEAQVLRSLVENGVAKRFNLRAWSDGGCNQATGVERLQVLFEQVRPDVAKLIVLEELEVRFSPVSVPTTHVSSFFPPGSAHVSSSLFF